MVVGLYDHFNGLSAGLELQICEDKLSMGNLLLYSTVIDDLHEFIDEFKDCINLKRIFLYILALDISKPSFKHFSSLWLALTFIIQPRTEFILRKWA